MTKKRQGKREREARKRVKRSVIILSNGTGVVTLKLGRKKLSEYFRKKDALPF